MYINHTTIHEHKTFRKFVIIGVMKYESYGFKLDLGLKFDCFKMKIRFVPKFGT